MDKQKAILILTEMNKWRKAQEPYTEAGTPMPYTPQEFSKAIELAIKELSKQT